MATPTTELIARLEDAKHTFTGEARLAKRRALDALARRSIRSGALLSRYHEALCFLRAYPDDPGVLQAVEAALGAFPKRVAALGPRDAAWLDETGVAGTSVYCPLSYPAACWLAARFPDAVELDWGDPASEEWLEALLPRVVDQLAEEALVEVGMSYRAWLAAAKGSDPRSDLAWILDRVERRARDSEAPRAVYDRTEPRLRWALGDGPGSRTLARLPGRSVYFHRGPLIRRRGSRARRLPEPPVPVRRASRREAADLLDAARAAVVVRYREVHGFNFADPDDIVVAEAGRGVEVAWFGLLPAHRLPLRAHYGYLLLKNGVPVGYGDASLLFDWCEIAYNVFETFRGGEAAWIFDRLLAFIRQWLGVRAFHLTPYQLGLGNDEALSSGAVWFYYKLGFRPTRPDLARLAREERRRIARNPAYRSSREALARLSAGRMTLGVVTAGDPAERDFDAGRVARRAAAGASAADLAGALGVADARRRAWPRAERVAFARLTPILATIPGLARWPARERRALVGIIRAKGGASEAEYLRRLQAHGRLRRSLLVLGAPKP